MFPLRLHLNSFGLTIDSWTSFSHFDILWASCNNSRFLEHLTTILVVSLLLKLMLMLLVGQNLLNFVHLILSVIINHVLMLSHSSVALRRSIVLGQMHLRTASIIPQPAICLNRFNSFALFCLFLHLMLNWYYKIQNMNLKMYYSNLFIEK